jgi:hypothetical protein
VTMIVVVALLLVILAAVAYVDVLAARRLARVETRILAALERYQTEVSDRLTAIHEEETHQRELLSSIDGRVATSDAAMRLLPSALEALRSTVKTSVQELQENILPPEAKEIGKGALTRVAGMRERLRAQEAASLEEFQKAVADGAPVPAYHVRPGD